MDSEISKLLEELESLGVKFTVVPRLDGSLRLNCWRTLECWPNRDRIDQVLAERIKECPEVAAQIAEVIYNRSQDSRAKERPASVRTFEGGQHAQGEPARLINSAATERFQSATALQQRIRSRAYEIWTNSGCVQGQADQHWLTAEREILAESTLMAVGCGAPPNDREVLHDRTFAHRGLVNNDRSVHDRERAEKPDL